MPISSLLIKAIAPLSSDQLALRVAPHLRSIGENVAHIISGRVGNFHLLMGEGSAELAPLEEWDLPGASPRSAVELVRGLEATWQMISYGSRSLDTCQPGRRFRGGGERETV